MSLYDQTLFCFTNNGESYKSVISNIYNQTRRSFFIPTKIFMVAVCRSKHKQSSCPASIIIFITWNSESNHAQLVQTVYPGEMFVCLASPPGTRGRCTSVHEYTSRFSFQTNKTFCTAAEKKKKTLHDYVIAVKLMSL